jgi:hypothetical protein
MRGPVQRQADAKLPPFRQRRVRVLEGSLLVAAALCAAGQAGPRHESTMEKDKIIHVADYTLTFPGWWYQVETASKPPLYRLNSIVKRDVTFDFVVVQGHGTAAELTRYLSEASEAYQGQDSPAEVRIAGILFSGLRTVKPAALSETPLAIVENYAAVVGNDLVAFSFTTLVEADTNSDLRIIAMRIVETAVLKHAKR